jgi:hypothetical protein
LIKKQTIGGKDKANFPGLGLERVDIKMGTGAYTSAMHCHEIKPKKIAGREVLFSPSSPHLITRTTVKRCQRKKFAKVRKELIRRFREGLRDQDDHSSFWRKAPH